METKKVVIDVLQSDIDKGIQGNDQRCMIARVVKRMIKHKYRADVSVYPDGIDIFNEDLSDNVHIDLDARISNKIKEFDAKDGKKYVEPFSFQIELPKDMLSCRKKRKTHKKPK